MHRIVDTKNRAYDKMQQCDNGQAPAESQSPELLVNGPQGMNYAQGAAALSIVAVLFGGDLVTLFRGEQVGPRLLLCRQPDLFLRWCDLMVLEWLRCLNPTPEHEAVHSWASYTLC